MSNIPFDADPRDDNDGVNYDFLGRFDLDADGHFTAFVFENTDAPDIEELNPTLDALFDAIGFDVNSQDGLLDLIVQSADNVQDAFGFDPNADDSRGGYTREEVQEFLNETGFWGISDVYYDEELQEYYVDINYEEGAV